MTFRTTQGQRIWRWDFRMLDLFFMVPF